MKLELFTKDHEIVDGYLFFLAERTYVNDLLSKRCKYCIDVVNGDDNELVHISPSKPLMRLWATRN